MKGERERVQHTLAGSEGGWEDGIDGLERVSEGGKDTETKSNIGVTSEPTVKTNTRGRRLSGGESRTQEKSLTL